MAYDQSRDGNDQSGESNLVSELTSAAAASAGTGRIPLLPNADNVVYLPEGVSLDDLSVQGRDI